MKNKKAIFITGLVGFSLILIGLFVYINFFFGKYLEETVLECDFLITSDWKEIDIKDLVKIEKDINYISILLEPEYESFTVKGGGIKTPSGEVVNPEIKLIDEDGKEYLLTYGGARRSAPRNEYANYRYETDLPINKKYEKVLIRSDIPIKTQKIIWSSYNARDRK